MRKLFAFVAALLLSASFANAQAVFGGFTVVPLETQAVSAVVSATDTEPILVIRYFQPTVPGASAVTSTIASTVNTNLTFTVGGAAYTGFECPVAGGLGGVIDVTNAACNTLGEVVDVINSTPITFSTGYFRAAIVNGLRADASNTILTAGASSDASNPDTGVVLYQDTSATTQDSIAMVDYSKLGRVFFNSKGLAPNPFVGVAGTVLSASSRVTNGGTIGNFTLYGVTRVYGQGKGCVATATCGPNAGSSETARTIYLEAAGATTVRGALDEMMTAGGFRLNPGEFALARRTSDAASSVLSNFITGLIFKLP